MARAQTYHRLGIDESVRGIYSNSVGMVAGFVPIDCHCRELDCSL